MEFYYETTIEKYTKRGGEQRMYWVTGGLGLLLAVAPFLFGFTDNTNAMWSSVILGGVTVAVSIYEGLGHSRDRWEYWVALGAGLAAAAAPFALSVGPITAALWTTIGIGLLLMGSAATKLFNGKAQFG